jgi:CheY-like chemotaxis protein
MERDRATPLAASDRAALGSELVLVDDNQADVDLVLYCAEAVDLPLEIRWINNGAEALTYLRERLRGLPEQRPRLVLLDLGLPRLSGFEVLEALHGEGLHAAAPVIVLSTSRRFEDQRRSRELGVRDYWFKPRDLDGYEQLMQRLQREVGELGVTR